MGSNTLWETLLACALHSGAPISRAQEDDGDIAVSAEQGEVVFRILRQECVSNGLTHTSPARVPLRSSAYVGKILHGAAQFYRKLGYQLSEDNFFRDNITLECYKMQTVDGYGKPLGDNLNDTDTITVEAGRNSEYGLRIYYKGFYPLYAAVFLMNCSDMSIRE